ncbi:MAG: Abi-alpha family protein [Solirubrobacterales bacterium]
MSTDRPEQTETEMDLPSLNAIPGLARLAAGAWWHGATWGVGTALGATKRVAEAATSGESANQLLEEIRDETLGSLRRALVVVEDGGAPETATDAFRAYTEGARTDKRKRTSAESLRARGAELLERAAEVSDGDVAVHPGFDRIVDQLAPDEARVLKLLANDGAQPIVYINKAGPMGIGARTVARRLSLIGREAGCLHPELLPAYLDNLVRLGLASIRQEPVGDEREYQVVEAQPEVVEAMDSVGGGPLFSAQSARKSVHITEFGKAFCQVCFPPSHLTGKFKVIEIDPVEEILPPEMEPEARGPDEAV